MLDRLLDICDNNAIELLAVVSQQTIRGDGETSDETI